MSFNRMDSAGAAGLRYLQRQNTVGKSIRPKFGWGWEGHTAIERAAIGMLPASSYKSLLENQTDLINLTSINQDKYKMGAGHFLNIENIEKYHGSGLGTLADEPDKHFASVLRAFKPKGKQAQAAAFRTKPLQAVPLETYSNVFHSIVKNYRDLVDQLRQISQGGHVSRQLTNSVVETIGTLAHYVGDLNQPMHTTRYHDWPSAFPWMTAGKNGKRRTETKSHSYFERALFNRADYHAWQNQMAGQGAKPEQLNFSQIKDRMLRRLEEAYLKMFDVVEGDRAARKSRQEATYFSKLDQAWKPIAAEQMGQAARDLATILHSAWEEAGRPNLPPAPKVKVNPTLLED